MEENNKNTFINGPDNLLFGLEEFGNLPMNDKSKNITKILKREIMSDAIKWCQEHIKGFNVDIREENGNIIITGNCYIDDMTLEKLPYKIHKVEGNFTVCGDPTIPRVMRLKTLNNFPDIVTGNFKINLNYELTSLAGGPREVGGYYNCAHCNLSTLDGIAPKIGQYIVAYKNPLINIDVLKNTEFTNIDLDYCDGIKGSQMLRSLRVAGKLYEDIQHEID